VRGKDGTRAFLKALDYSPALGRPDAADILKFLSSAYIYERDLAEKCRKMDRVVRALDYGQIQVGPDLAELVQYLILELGDGDIRQHLATVDLLNTSWRLRALHNVATGLKQLHGADISPQDLKPSNVVVFNGTVSKVSDLGRATTKGQPSPFESISWILCDRNYAPPEQLYGRYDADWVRLRQGCDMYLLGSMIAFVFTGTSMTHLVQGFLHQSHRCTEWKGTYDDVLPYVRAAFNQAVDAVSAAIRDAELRQDLTAILRQLCDPDPSVRGDSKNRLRRANPFSPERYITHFDVLARKAARSVSRTA
jgi:serine/threonine protein kinase